MSDLKLQAAPLDSYSAEDRAFYAMWYAHMTGDIMQPPLCGVDHATARYIWDAARRAEPSPVADDGLPPVAVPRYTCKGKGGEYALVGVAYGAGTSRGTTLILYRDIAANVMYFRAPTDFHDRMEHIDRQPQKDTP